MSSRKFFSGLPANMMTRSTGPNRQQTNFYWPDESNADEISTSRSSRMRNRSLSTASVLSQSQASTDTEESRKRRSKELKSRIEFYDMVDTATDNESVFSRKLDPTKHKKLETLKSRIEFYDYVDTRDSSQLNDDDTNSVIEVVQKKVNEEVKSDINGKIDTPVENNKIFMSNNNNEHIDELANNVNKISMNAEYSKNDVNNHKAQYIDSYSESDDEDYRYQKSYRGNQEAINRNFQQKYRRPPMPKQPQPQHQYQQLRPRRYQSQYFDDFEDDGYDRYYDNASIRSSRARLPRAMPTRRHYSPDVSDEEFYDARMYPIKNGRMSRDYRNYEAYYSPEREYSRGPNGRFDDYYESYRDDRRQTNNRNPYGSEMDYNGPKSKSPTQKQQQQKSTNEIDNEQNIPSTSARPPIKPVTRSMSINEARRRHHINLKSNIFHNDSEYEQVVGQRKPLSVREFAGIHRIGVGLPDLH